MAKELITVQFYKEEIVKRKDGTIVQGKDGNPLEKGLLVGTTDGQFPRTVAFTVFNSDARFQCKTLQPNDKADIAFDVESREWNGRYFTDAKAWGIEVKSSNSDPIKPSYTKGAEPTMAAADGDDDELPF